MATAVATKVVAKRVEEPKLPAVGLLVRLKTIEVETPKDSASVEDWTIYAHSQNQMLDQITDAGKQLACDASVAMWNLGHALVALKRKAGHGEFTGIKEKLGVSNGNYDRSTKLYRAVKNVKELIGVPIMKALREYGVIEAKPVALPAPKPLPKPKAVMDELDDLLIEWDAHPSNVSVDLLNQTERNLKNSLKAIEAIKAKLAKAKH